MSAHFLVQNHFMQVGVNMCVGEIVAVGVASDAGGLELTRIGYVRIVRGCLTIKAYHVQPSEAIFNVVAMASTALPCQIWTCEQ